VATGTGRINI